MPDEVIKALDPNSTDASIKSLNEVVSQINKTEAYQLALTVPTMQKTVADNLTSIAQVLDGLEILGAEIRSQLDETLSVEQQAQHAIRLQHDLLASAKGQFIDQYTQFAFTQMLPLKSLQQFTQESSAKGLTGDALWLDVINSIVQYTNTSTFGCFAAGTLVHTEQGWTPIQDIKVGDLVLSKPENGEGEASYKPVLNTFVYENKELWLITSKKYWNNKDIHGKRINNRLHDSTSRISEFLATPNHPVWVVGIGVPNVEERVESIIAYTKLQWKRVDQLQQYEVMVNKDGIMFYIERAQPLYQFHNEQIEGKPSYIWYQDQYYYMAPYINREDFEASEEFKDYVDYQEYLEKEVQKVETGWVRDIENYYVAHITGSNIKDADGIAWHRNNLTDTNGRYIPFNDTVYNLEVDGNSTYYVDSAGVFVHNTSSPEQTLLQMATDLANNVARIGVTELNQMYAVAKQYWLNAGASQTDWHCCK